MRKLYSNRSQFESFWQRIFERDKEDEKKARRRPRPSSTFFEFDEVAAKKAGQKAQIVTASSIVLGTCLVLSLSLFGEPKFKKEVWLASAGLGFAMSPGVLLLSPRVETPYRDNLYLGPLFQIGVGGSTVFTASGAMRYFLSQDRVLRPCLELGLGLSAASESFGDKSTMGILIQFGLGFDYWVADDIAFGTMLRANLAPPVKTLFFSWPMFIGRFLI